MPIPQKANGPAGHLRDRLSCDIVTQAITGAMSVTGEPGRPSVKLGLPMHGSVLYATTHRDHDV
jgi:crotonobetainyl-CoA:carnitine CoA-transferase CaiB-like acyl-CoA transferase